MLRYGKSSLSLLQSDMKNSQNRVGFALPTVMITSILMLSMLLVALQITITTSTSLRTQYYNQLAREAAERGTNYARFCLSKNNDVAQWSNDIVDQTLAPDTDCFGNAISGASKYVMSNSLLQTSFTVGKVYRSDGLQRVLVHGIVELKRKSDGKVYRSYSYNSSGQTSASTLVRSVGFGYTTASYCARPGAYFATIDEFGRVNSTGLNACGQLGNGTKIDTPVPAPFGIPSNKVASQVFTNFLSLGMNLFVLTTDGEVWGSGANDHGQLGGGKVSESETTPIKFKLPAIDSVATFVAPLGWTTFVVTSNGNIYSAGRNTDGVAGVGDTPYGKDNDVIVPTKVPLPDGEKARVDSSSWAVDRLNAYVITESGKVYAWGANEYGQLAKNNTSKNRTPIQLNIPNGELAEQVAYDGDTVYVRTAEGNVFSAGRTTFGQTGSSYARLVNVSTDKCLTASGSTLTLSTCNDTASNQLWKYETDGTLRVQSNSSPSLLCVDNQSAGNQYARMYTCNSSVAQKFMPAFLCPSSSNCEPYSSRIVNSTDNLSTGKYCLHYNSAGDSKVGLKSCGSSSAQAFIAYDATLRQVELPSDKKAVDISTDQWFATAVMDDGSVYTWGLNNGAFGNGVVPRDENDKDSHLQWNRIPVKYGSFGESGQPKAVLSWTTSGGWSAERSNIFVVTSDGKVFGTGSNTDGQLGIGSTNSTSTATPQQMNIIGQDGDYASLVKSGRGTTVIYTSNGKVFTVGDNGRGQLGDGTTTNSSIPRANAYTNVKAGAPIQF